MEHIVYCGYSDCILNDYINLFESKSAIFRHILNRFISNILTDTYTNYIRLIIHLYNM